MKRWTSVLNLVVAGALAATAAVTSPDVSGARQAAAASDTSAPAVAQVSEETRDDRPGKRPKRPAAADRWVNSWTSMPQLTEPHNMPPAPFTRDGLVLADSTLRQTIHTTIGGERLRLRFSNAFGGAVLPITSVEVALPQGGKAGASAIRPGSSRPVTFHGKPSVSVPVGAQMVSDPLDFTVAPGSELTVTLYLAEGQASNDITSHPGSRTTSHLLAGDHTGAADLPGATPTDHWYFLSGLEVTAGSTASAVAVLGDSLTDGRGSTTNGNDRWPDLLAERLRAGKGTSDVAVLNQAAGGNRVLQDGLGPNVLARMDRDVLAQSGVEWLIVLEGINDIGTAQPTQAAQHAVVDQLIAAYDQIVTRAHAQDIRVYGATMPPFGGNEMYDDPDGHREASRQAVNEWIRNSGAFDSVIDFDAATRDPEQPERLLETYDTGDHLHLNPAGYQAMADAVPARLFR
ncbi:MULTISPECIES: SGNH/GDSL hydrolase family protein [Streptomyces]|uniref:SGNH/GDSL hydrolase family protein n=2 Tax=Streptomyces TaxID=1883 RepID=A0A3R7H8V4_9ACTN|nr:MULTISPECIES: SGNH/GDSL hydrolase family protein [Streptomyces]KNE79995.1 SGNH hydrolase [Streptomyces fradiae]OFA34044.1 SGNH hydrolase [Streptomyces fradiae]PQM23806.1 SGNH/GDSL hydrolase family protein [Streptomyces xinghaiensis]RKM91795.1 SGNH/GDSL hydrolase family protein [Streptomyces xinghaiensis]RNC73499.1 SGNH/GDSL hydrolase family protein [Streptomyces xinghaiensis]